MSFALSSHSLSYYPSEYVVAAAGFPMMTNKITEIRQRYTQTHVHIIEIKIGEMVRCDVASYATNVYFPP